VSTKKQVVDIKVARVRNKSLWRNGAKKSGRPKMSMKNVVRLKLLPRNIKRVSDGRFLSKIS
jgi:hypothetical protein